MDREIQETVEAILGKDVKVIDCEKKSSIKEEEVLLVNGCPVTLDGDDGAAIKDALLRGNIPNCHSLNEILVRVGILKAPVKLETNLSVKSNVVTREEVTVAKGGQVVDERSRETKEDNFYTSNTSEIWEPVGIVTNDTPSEFLTRNLNVKHEENGDKSGKSSDKSSVSDSCCSSSSKPHCSRTSTPSKYQETRMSSVSQKFSSDVEDKTDYVYSKHTVNDNVPRELPLHVLPLKSTLKSTSVSNSSVSYSLFKYEWRCYNFLRIRNIVTFGIE